jgi:hypothetical protein
MFFSAVTLPLCHPATLQLFAFFLATRQSSLATT